MLTDMTTPLDAMPQQRTPSGLAMAFFVPSAKIACATRRLARHDAVNDLALSMGSRIDAYHTVTQENRS
ncbi:MAG: hypothetical protein P4L70_09955 [Parasulfuritortus sp.]|nr:hypothetical protein [Parasulfuritortus sp.]